MDFDIRVVATDWEQYAGPEYYDSQEIVKALIALSKLEKKDKDDHMYNRVLFAVGNNHAGTYYPAIFSALPFIEEISAFKSNGFASGVAGEILLDLLGGFCAETGSYTKHSPKEIESFVHSRRPTDFDDY